MHEWSLACALVRTAEEEARRRGAARVHGISVTVGFLTGIVPELLNRAYEMARVGTALEGAPLEVTVEPVLAKCPSCAAESRFEGFALVCPACGEPGLEVLSGDDILLRGMDLETEGPA